MVFFREISSLAARCHHQVDISFLPKGLHNIGCMGMRARLQEKLDTIDDLSYDAVLWGYGICNNGLVGIEARSRPFVLPRAHDCISIFFGGRERHEGYSRKNPGAYYQTPGWIEREENEESLQQLSITNRLGMDQSYEMLVKKYGEDNAAYLKDQLHGGVNHYGKITYLDTGVADDNYFASVARNKARQRDWEFERKTGDLTILERMVNGDWNSENFLVVPPGHRVAAAYDGTLVRSESVATSDKE